jgi:flagellar M-ring protein FliF
MPFDLNWSNLREQILRLKERWEELPSRTRVLLGIFGGGLLAGIVIWLVLVKRGPALAPLYTDLDGRDASEIVAFLEEQKVSYKLENGGATVLVPKSDVDKLRLSLAGKGLPHSGTIGFEIFDKQGFGKTDFERRLDYVRGLQGELERTIGRMAGVDDVRVHLVIPEDRLFISQDKAASAAVLLNLKPLFAPNSAEIQSVVFLVSRAVEGLAPEDVTVVDSRGAILYPLQNGPDPFASQDGQFHGLDTIELTREFEAELSKSVETLLYRVFGPGNAVVRVKAELDLNRQTVERRLFQPVADPEALTRSVQELEETFRGSGYPPQGSGPVDSNIPGYQIPSGDDGQSEYSRREATRNLEINEIREQTVVAPGSVKRLSVSVVINQSLDSLQVEAISEAIAAAIGYDPDRNDQITVTGIPFDTSLADAIREQQRSPYPLLRFLESYKVVFVAVLSAALLALYLLRRKGRLVQKEKIDTTSPPVESLPKTAGWVDQVAREATPVGRLPDLGKDPEQVQIERLVSQSPEVAAKLIHAWITEE